MKKEEIEKICKRYDIENYTINEDGIVDVDGDVNLYRKKLTELPLKFGKITGYFDCSDNQLTSLEGCPKWVGGHFCCFKNKLTTLEGCPNWVGGNFTCEYNQLTSLDGCPDYVDGDFCCNDNQLKTLNGCPNYVGGRFLCDYIDNEFVTQHNNVHCILDHKSFIKQNNRDKKLKELLND